MKVYLFVSPKKRQVKMYDAYFENMRRHLDVSSTLAGADVVLFFGGWSFEGARIAKRAVKMGIPYIVCPLGDFSLRNTTNPYCERKIKTVAYQRKMCQDSQLLVATTSMEFASLTKLGWNKHIILLRYFAYSQLVGLDETIGKWLKETEDVLSSWEERKAALIASKTKDEIVMQIMQIRSRMPHKNIPQNYLDRLHELLYADNYDEDSLCEELTRLKLADYAASVFEVMTEKTGLTEGFMPLPAHTGRKSREILSYITPAPHV